MNSWDKLILVHYTDRPIGKLHTCLQSDDLVLKPKGLWVSVEGKYGWKEWCEDNDFNLNRFEYHYKIKLKPNSNIWHIQNPEELKLFHLKFITEKFGGLLLQIDWTKVSQLCQGLIISPYIWSMRLEPDYLWYYGWDCASGCLWDVSCVEKIERRNNDSKKNQSDKENGKTKFN